MPDPWDAMDCSINARSRQRWTATPQRARRSSPASGWHRSRGVRVLEPALSATTDAGSAADPLHVKRGLGRAARSQRHAPRESTPPSSDKGRRSGGRTQKRAGLHTR
jgi:hypothetical protein